MFNCFFFFFSKTHPVHKFIWTEVIILCIDNDDGGHSHSLFCVSDVCTYIFTFVLHSPAIITGHSRILISGRVRFLQNIFYKYYLYLKLILLLSCYLLIRYRNILENSNFNMFLKQGICCLRVSYFHMDCFHHPIETKSPENFLVRSYFKFNPKGNTHVSNKNQQVSD